MAQLPARQPVALATLLQRNAPPPRTTRAALAQRRTHAALGAPMRTLADIEADSSIAPRDTRGNTALFVKPPTPPSALVLWIQVATCLGCGRVHRLPSTSVLIKYAENEHSVHHKRDDAALAALPADLPRELRTREVSLPYCEECFL